MPANGDSRTKPRILVSDDDANVRYVDVMRYISTRGQEELPPPPDNTTTASSQHHVWDDMASRFPSPRWETILHKWGMAATNNYGSGLHKRSMKPSQRQALVRAERFLQVLCVLLKEDWEAKGDAADDDDDEEEKESVVKLQLRWHPVDLLTPGSPRRYGKALHRPDQLVNATCV